MDFLKETECLSGLYWCYRHDEPPEEIQKVVERHSGYFIPIEGFDEMMYLMGQRFGYTDPLRAYRKRGRAAGEGLSGAGQGISGEAAGRRTPARPRAPSSGPWTPNSGRSFSGWIVASRLDEEDREAYWERGKLYYFANDYAQALEDFTKAKELGMEDSKLYWYKGFCYRRLGETELAIREYSRSLELKGDFGGVPQSGPVLYHCEAV